VTDIPILEFSQVRAGYGEIQVLHDVGFSVPKGSVLALLGANGAGKTTTLRVAAGMLAPTCGCLRLAGSDMTNWSSVDRARSGLCLIPEGRGIFHHLTVAENLRMQTPPWIKAGNGLDAAVEAFPILGSRRKQVAGTLSGGEQQMVALARAWLANPSIVLLDEVSMGLAPTAVDTIFAGLHALVREGTSLLIVEQYVHRALGIADFVMLLDRGTVAHFGPAASVEESDLLRTYLGEAAADDDFSTQLGGRS
jgi:branched-chain amino acid transport system ATP-binding protein